MKSEPGYKYTQTILSGEISRSEGPLTRNFRKRIVLCVPEGPGSRKEATTDSLGRPGRRVRNYQTRFSWFHQVSSCVSTFLSETAGLPACVCDQLIQPFQADIPVVSKIRSRGGGRRRQHLRPGSVRARGRLDRTSIARYFSNGSGSFNHFFHHRDMPMIASIFNIRLTSTRH